MLYKNDVCYNDKIFSSDLKIYLIQNDYQINHLDFSSFNK